MMSDKKTTFFCLNPVRHAGDRYTKTIDLTEAEAKPLLDMRAITRHDPEKLDAAEAAEQAEKNWQASEEAEAEAKAKAEAEAEKPAKPAK